jgi:hypothetical protein
LCNDQIGAANDFLHKHSNNNRAGQIRVVKLVGVDQFFVGLKF